MSRIRELIDFIREMFLAMLRANRSSIASQLRSKLHRTACGIDAGVIITHPENFEAAARTFLYHGCYVLNAHGRVRLGENSHLGAYCYVNAGYGNVSIGADVAIGPGTRIFSHSNYYASGKRVSQERITIDVLIGNNVFIGANCTILPGSVIHDNVIVGAGAVVKGDLASNAIYGGVPAKLIRPGWYA